MTRETATQLFIKAMGLPDEHYISARWHHQAIDQIRRVGSIYEQMGGEKERLSRQMVALIVDINQPER